MPSETSGQLQTFGETIEYDIRRSDEATQPRIDLDIHGVTVVLPVGSDVDPHQLVESNARWVLDQWRTYQTHRDRAPDRSFEPGEAFPFRGTERRLAVRDVDRPHITSNEFVLSKDALSTSTIQEELESLYRREARTVFEHRINRYAANMNVDPGKLELRNQRTRWASCSPQRTLSFNWRLVMAPDEVIDYVVVHELAHLRESNHTRRFWDIVRQYDPDYEAHVEWLTENSARLIFSKEDL